MCTNKPLATTAPVLDALDLSRYFSAVVCGDRVPHPKPDPRHIFDTLKLMEAGADGAVMVGDSESDIGAAVAADVASVAVSFGYCHVPLAELGADAVIDDLSTLPETLTRDPRPPECFMTKVAVASRSFSRHPVLRAEAPVEVSRW